MIITKRTGRTWSVFSNGVLVEGGFFARLAAEHAAREWQENQDCNCPDCGAPSGDNHAQWCDIDLG